MLDEHRRARVLRDDDVADVVGGAQQTDTANEVLLVPLLGVAAACVRVATLERVEKLLQRHFVIAQLRQIRVHLVLLDQAAEADDIGDTGDQLELTPDYPVLQSAQLAGISGVRLEGVAVHLADGRGQRR